MPKAKHAPPVKEFRLGRVKALVWANDTERGTMHNVTFQRLYHDGKEWQSTESFGRDDLPLIQKVADQAHTWIYEEAARQQAEEKAQAAA
jgi:hypothetical protein